MIDRATLSAGDAYLLDQSALRARELRDANRAAGRCINAPSPAAKRPGRLRGVSHDGPLDRSGRCPHCREVKHASE